MKKWEILELGGPKSGNWGHAGRPGQRGGSVSRSVAMSIKSGKDWKERQGKKGGKKFGSSGVESVTPIDPRDKGINDSVILEFADGSKGIFKHENMEHGSAEGEILAYELSEALGWDIVPETIEFTYGGQRGSLQKWVPDAEVAIDYKGKEATILPFDGLINVTNPAMKQDWDRVRVLDDLLNNGDRHMGNLLIGKDKVWAIDNGGAFHIGLGGKKDANVIEYEPMQKTHVTPAMQDVMRWAMTPASDIFIDKVSNMMGYEYGYRVSDALGEM